MKTYVQFIAKNKSCARKFSISFTVKNCLKWESLLFHSFYSIIFFTICESSLVAAFKLYCIVSRYISPENKVRLRLCAVLVTACNKFQLAHYVSLSTKNRRLTKAEDRATVGNEITGTMEYLVQTVTNSKYQPMLVTTVSYYFSEDCGNLPYTISNQHVSWAYQASYVQPCLFSRDVGITSACNRLY